MRVNLDEAALSLVCFLDDLPLNVVVQLEVIRRMARETARLDQVMSFDRKKQGIVPDGPTSEEKRGVFRVHRREEMTERELVG